MAPVEQTNFDFLRRLEGLEVRAVGFVRDHLKLEFQKYKDAGTPILSVMTSPRMETIGEPSIRWGQPGFRDSLWARISEIVTQVNYVPDESVSIRFGQKGTLIVPLAAESPNQAESLTLEIGLERLVM